MDAGLEDDDIASLWRIEARLVAKIEEKPTQTIAKVDRAHIRWSSPHKSK
jgi:hypothetical protein